MSQNMDFHHSRRAYRFLLKLSQRGLERSHGLEAERLFAEVLRSESRRLGRLGFLYAWMATLSDMARITYQGQLRRKRERTKRGAIMSAFLQDLRYGLRILVKNPGFSLVALLTLAVGVGANTAIFSVVNAVLLRPLPYPQDNRLVVLWEAIPEIGFSKAGWSPPDLEFLKQQQKSFVHLGAVTPVQYEVSGGAEPPDRVLAGRVTEGFFQTLGIAPALGRIFSNEEQEPGSAVVVLGDAVWRHRFDSDAAVVGKTLRLDRRPHTIVGVMPRGFEFTLPGVQQGDRTPDLWIPRSFTSRELQSWGMQYNHSLIARLRPGTTLEQARTEAQLLAPRIQEQYPAQLLQVFKGAKLSLVVSPLREELVGDSRTLLLLLLGAVAFVLLIGCANVANLLLARTAFRRKEIALRGAMGASRTRIVVQMLTESLALGAGGGLLGLALAFAGLPLLLALSPDSLPREAEIAIDWRVLVFALAVSLGTAVLFSIAPALGLTNRDLNESLQDAARGSSKGVTRKLQAVFAVSQLTLALVLLIGAGLLMRSFAGLLQVDPGFQPERVLAVRVPLPLSGYPQAHQIRSFYQELIAKMLSLPGVAAAGLSSDLPLKTTEVRGFVKEGSSVDGMNSPPSATYSWIQGDYLEAMGVPLLGGRGFTPQDRQGAPSVVLISQSMAETFWPGEDPVGQRILNGPRGQPQTIVGIVGDVKDGAIHEEPRPHIYAPYDQEADGTLVSTSWDALRALHLAVRTQGDAESLARTLRTELRRMDPDLAQEEIRAMQDRIGDSLAPQRFNLLLLSIFASSALFLAAVGIYGVVSYSVSQRTQEVGIRMALGASRASTLALVLMHGLRLVAVSAVIGLAAAFGLTRLMSSLLFEVSFSDPLTYAAVPILLCLVALLACYLPARRASRVDPIEALRCE